MVEIMGRPFLEHQLDQIHRNGITDVLLCIGHLGEQIEDYFGDGHKFGLTIEYSREEKPLGTAGALRNAEKLLDDVFSTLYGDSYLFLDFEDAMNYFLSQNKLALMSVYKNFDRYDRSNVARDRELVHKFSKKDKTKDMVYIDYGANIFRKEILQMIPKGDFCSLEDIFPKLVEMGELLAYEVQERFYEIGSPQGIKDLEEFIKNVRGTKTRICSCARN
jgi:NDP-sugar pyrophosphorylase family protein